MEREWAPLVLASMRCGVIAVDTAGVVVLWNRPAAEILGVGPEAALGRDCRRVLGGCPALARLLVEALSRTALPDRAELEVRIGDRGPVKIGFTLSRVVDPGGRTAGAAVFFKDLTLVEEQREREALRDRLAGLGETTARIAHELRNRLGGVRAFLGLVRRRLAGDPQGLGYLERAEAELLAANAKMGEVLAFVRPVELRAGPVDPEAVCREAADAVRARLAGAAPRLEWEVTGPCPPVRADRARLRDALANLLANAFEAAGPDGRVRVRVGVREGPAWVASDVAGAVPGMRGFEARAVRRVVIEIDDDGPGMDSQVLRRIFQPFFTTKREGSGLGIPVAQKILDAHGGTLDVSSAPGRGTTVRVELPAVPEE